MKIVFVSNFFNHHQADLSDSLYKITKGNYYFIETKQMPESFEKTGYKKFKKKYIIKLYNSDVEYQKSMELINNADVVIFGSTPFKYIEKRIKQKKLTFRYSERIFKNFCNKLEYPIRFIKYIYEGGRNQNSYLLSASAYASTDFNKFFCYKNRIYKWGYFPKTPEFYDINTVLAKKEDNSLLWVGRLISWKHPEHAIQIVQKLKIDGYNFHLNIIGNGKLKEKLEKMVIKMNLKNEVSFLGNMPSNEVQNYMRKTKIYLATSDYNEGWGAVVNEAMGNACAVIGNIATGSIPYLIKDKNNGFVYNNGNLNEAIRQIEFLLNNNQECKKIGYNAYNTIKNLWNGEIAAKRLVNISTAILTNRKNNQEFKDGPCSKAE